jgi:hypothetical protein
MKYGVIIMDNKLGKMWNEVFVKLLQYYGIITVLICCYIPECVVIIQVLDSASKQLQLVVQMLAVMLKCDVKIFQVSGHFQLIMYFHPI